MKHPPMLLTGKKPITLIRRGSGDYVGGRFVEGAEEQVEILASCQPVLKSTRTFLFDEMDWTKVALKVYSTSEIRMLREGHWAADRFMWDGLMYEVMGVISWKMGRLDYFHALCKKVDNS